MSAPNSPENNAAGHAQLILEHFLPYRLSVLSNRVSQTIADMYQKRFGLAITEWRVMAVLGRFADLSANEVSARRWTRSPSAARWRGCLSAT